MMVIAAILVLAGFAMSQSTGYKTLQKTPSGRGGLLLGVPQARWSDGKMGGGYARPDPNYQPSRTPDGQPDIQGVWTASTITASQTIEAIPGDGGYFFVKTESMVVDPADGKIPYRAWARSRTEELFKSYISPLATCAPTGMPRQMYYVDSQVIQTDGEVLIVNEHLQNFRHIPLDGRPHIASQMKLWMGDSRGRWEGNSLVIDVSNLNDETWMSTRGDFHSNRAHITERLTPVDAETLQYEATIEDPVAYEKPWKMAFPLIRLPKNYEMLEENCREGNKSVEVQLELGRRLFTGIGDVPDAGR